MQLSDMKNGHLKNNEIFWYQKDIYQITRDKISLRLC